jgi:hypothetical protein
MASRTTKFTNFDAMLQNGQFWTFVRFLGLNQDFAACLPVSYYIELLM